MLDAAAAGISPAELAQVTETIAAHLGDVARIGAATAEPSTEPRLVLRRSPSGYSLELADASRGVALRRDVEGSGRGLAADAELVGIVARSMVASLFASEQPRPPVVPQKARETPAPTWPRLHGTLGYAGGPLGSAVLWQHGLAATIGWRPRLRWLVEAGYVVGLPVRVAAPDVKLSLMRHSLHAAGAYVHVLSPAVEADMQLRVTADVVVPHNLEIEPPLQARRLRARVVPALGLRNRWYFGRRPQLRGFIGFGVDVLLARFTSVIVVDDGRRSVFAPWWIRTTVTAGVAFGGRQKRQSAQCSYAPTSIPAPCGRARPSMSNGGASSGRPASMAGESLWSR